MGTFEEDLVSQSSKLIRRFERYAREQREEDRRREKRDGKPRHAEIIRPAYWVADPAFDPYSVRRRADKISRSVRRALRLDVYRPFNPILYEVPKTDGTMRPVSIFPLVETTLATRVFRSLAEKNAVLMSGNSYAYRVDRSPHDAVQRMSIEFASPKRIYVAEYDFSKYFETLSHDAIFELAERKGVLWTSFEREVIRKFLQTRPQNHLTYERFTSNPHRSVGIPQGNSLSLFLANIAALDMDSAIERNGVGYVRYADDTVMWSEDYSRLVDAVEAMRSHAAVVGAIVNPQKSSGIRIFGRPDENMEFASTETVPFIGYEFHRDKASIRDATVRRIKEKVARIIWLNLLSSTNPFTLQPSRFAEPVDRDYVAMVFQLRRYIYGGMSETRLKKLLRGRSLRIKFPGVMSYFPLVSDTAQLKALDGWLVHTVRTSLELRRRAVLLHGGHLPQWPYNTPSDELIVLQATTKNGRPIDLTLPSFTRMGTAIYRASQTHGANAVARSAKGAQYLYGLGS